MDDAQRRAFANLILLCKPHHTLVDKTHPERYTISDLDQWKADREGDSAGVLADADGLDEDTIEESLISVTLTIFENGVYRIGGTGGSAPMAGGGGGGVLGSGKGGRGGPGGSIIVPDKVRIDPSGKPGTDVGAGGGGAGAVHPGSIKRQPGSISAVLGKGFSDGTDGAPGGDATVSDEHGNVLLHAPGGAGALAGTGVRSTTDKLCVSMLTVANYVQIRGTVDMMGGSWDWFSVLNLGDGITFLVLIVFEASGVEPGEYRVDVEASGPDDRRFAVRFPVTVETKGDVLRIPRFCHLPITVSAFGLWRLSVSHDDRELAAFDLIAKRTGEPET